jgi:hypothetical protein
MIGNVDNGGSRSSRIAFRDAVPKEDAEDYKDWYENRRILPILSSPKISATEFYMVDIPGAPYFNYDYMVPYSEQKKIPVLTPIKKPQLRGRKFYWHRRSVMMDDTRDFLNQRTEIRPVTQKKEFKFQIAFERLTHDELSMLIYTLTCGEHASSNAHKLGHGKPVGYGSVRISVDDVSLFSIDHKALSISTSPKSASDYDWHPDNTIAIREYLKMTDFEHAPQNVNYLPFDWFGINKEIRLGGFMPSFNDALPAPLDNRIFVYGYEAGVGDKTGNRSAFIDAKEPEPDSVTMQQSATIGDLKQELMQLLGISGDGELISGDGANTNQKASPVTRDFTQSQVKTSIKNCRSYSDREERRRILEAVLSVKEADADYYVWKRYLKDARRALKDRP